MNDIFLVLFNWRTVDWNCRPLVKPRCTVRVVQHELARGASRNGAPSGRGSGDARARKRECAARSTPSKALRIAIQDLKHHVAWPILYSRATGVPWDFTFVGNLEESTQATKILFLNLNLASNRSSGRSSRKLGTMPRGSTVGLAYMCRSISAETASPAHSKGMIAVRLTTFSFVSSLSSLSSSKLREAFCFSRQVLKNMSIESMLKDLRPRRSIQFHLRFVPMEQEGVDVGGRRPTRKAEVQNYGVHCKLTFSSEMLQKMLKKMTQLWSDLQSEYRQNSDLKLI